MNYPWRIAIETSGRKGSAAIGSGLEPTAHRAFATDTEHARDLLPVLESLFDESAAKERDIEHCYISIGPGSFTGLRVAVTFARHLALASGTRLVAVPTLDVIAMNALDLPSPPQHLAVILDAKRKQVFGALYELSGDPRREYRQQVAPCLVEPHALFSQTKSALAVIGEGIAYHESVIRNAGLQVLEESHWYPRAENVYRMGGVLAERGQFTAPRDLIPYYIRRPEAEELWEKKHSQ